MFSEGHPVISAGSHTMHSLSSSDEESFVVLGQSLIPDDLSSSDERPSVVGTEVVGEAKQWISSEINALEKDEQKHDEADGRLLKRGENIAAADTTAGTSREKKESLNSIGSVGSALERSAVLPEMPKVESTFDVGSPVSIASITSNLSSEEVQNKVAQIIEENIKLKETIQQNNMSMKSQYDRIVAWQEEVQKVHQAHKDKIFEAKACIEKLKKDKENLMLEVDKQRDVVASKNETIRELQETLNSKQSHEALNQTSDNNLKEFELDAANKKLKDLECENQKLKQEYANLQKDIERFEADSKPDKELIQKLQGELCAARMEVGQCQLEVIKGKEKLRDRETELGQILAGLREQMSKITPADPLLNEELEHTKTQLTNTQIMLTLAEQNKSDALKQVDTLGQQVTKLSEEMEELKRKNEQTDEMCALKTQLDVYKADFEAERSAKETIKLDKDKFLEDIQTLQVCNQQLQEELEKVRNELFALRLTRRSTTTSTSGGNTASSTSTRYTRDLPHIRSSYLNSSPLRRNILTRSYLRTPIRKSTMKCPKCNFGFTTLHALQNHVYRCIDLDDQIP
ncbi:unnamed protein product [Acanthoscelides obtectus]|uniref:NF-kappa-B essential modulator NEMO CC2-LZ domain-containing protein n=1 Tax=Acanthoscelides obtectus TaxID=200917 RepID=A0A9P0JKR5_ACAOB|nr:unnamed protein product [Acanthoscelides obtectus]CAK1672879.1 NF-kappa-B essential modulator [Acanthoscelides obtectus]